MHYLLHPAAFDDLQDAVDYYDEKSQGLGHQFVTQVESDLLRITDTPNLFFCPYPALRIRRYPMKRFPYSIFYRVDTLFITVIAVVHQAREPSHWLDRVLAQ